MIYAELVGITGPDFLQALVDDACFMGGALSGARQDRLVQAACERWLIAREDNTPRERLQLPVQLPIDLMPRICWITRDGIAYEGGIAPHTDDGRRGLRMLLAAAVCYAGSVRWPPAIARGQLPDLMHWLEAEWDAASPAPSPSRTADAPQTLVVMTGLYDLASGYLGEPLRFAFLVR